MKNEERNINTHAFTHLSSKTSFPGLPEDFKYENNFDYSKWDKNTEVRLFNVKWNDNYSNAVYFENEAARDKFFDEQISEKITLTSLMELFPSGNIKLPFTFDSASRFNYLEVIFPEMPVPEEYSWGRRKFFYFIESITQNAPSTTEFFLKLDTWTTFIYSCDIKYMVLERGHAPVSASNVDAYLRNPLRNSKYLLAEDYNVENTDLVPYQKVETLNDKDTYVCFAISAYMKGNWGQKQTDTWEIPQKSNHITEGVPNNLHCYCVKAQDYTAFMNYVYSNIPQWYRTLKGIYLIPGKLLQIKTSFSIGGIICYELDAVQTEISEFKLNKEMFGYSDHYKELAKLYTFPYAYIELSNEDGQKHQIKIENTNNDVKALANINIAFPFMKLEIMFTGIGNEKELSTSFINLDQKSFVYGGKWSDYLIEWDIPVYAVNPNVYSEFELDNYWQLRDLLLTADVVYQNDVDTTNMEFACTQNRANITQTNSYNDGNNTYNNADLDAACVVNNTSLGNSNMNNAASFQVDFNNIMTNHHNNKGWRDVDASTTVTDDSANAEIQRDITQGVASFLGSTAEGAITGGMVGAVAGPEGALAGAAIGAALSLPSGAVTLVNTAAGVNYTIQIAQIQDIAAWHQFDNAQGFNFSSNDATIDLLIKKLGSQLDTNSAQAGNSSYTLRGKGANTRATIQTNATNTWNMTNENAAYKKNVELNNAKRIWDLAQQKAKFRQDEGKIEKPKQYGEYDGSNSAAVKPLALCYNLITKSESAIAEIGDIFCRYGYMLNQNWDFKTFNVMKNFSYWKVKEIWITGKDKMLNERYRSQLIEILQNGITIWNDPNKINEVSIYDN